MSLIEDRLGYLRREYLATEIAEITGLSLSMINPTIDVIEPIDPNVRRNIYNFFNRTVYRDLREEGASAAEARRYRNKSVESILARESQRTELLNDLAGLRFDQYKSYLISQGRYISDDDTLATLRQSIAKSMGKSKLPPSHYDYESYPTLSHGVLDDDF